MSDAQVVFEISGDDSKAQASINSVTEAMKKAGVSWERNAEQSTSSIADKFTGMFKTISIAAVGAKIGQALISFGKDAISAASDLAEVQNVVDVTFGESAHQIDAWAKSAASSFGLTELQAKKFTSTLGAMMKSAGMAGPEIVTMSEDLSGLAADMASFYNLDFETAFQKIRSGISGQTEPLKELGINMSVANLEAFALTQGITKAFDAMSQSEQIQLRYQYLMQATADAQGDFARTSDGYANSLRKVETALDSIKATAGTFLLTMVEPLTSGLADILEKLTVPKGTTTVMDEFERIDLNTGTKLRDIEGTAEKARNLLELMDEISGYKINTTSSNNLVSFVESFSGSLTGLDDALTAARTGNYSETISELALALSAQLGGDPEKWKVLLTAIGDNAGDAIAAVSGDGGKTRVFLEGVAASADDLTTDYSTYWANLLTALGSNAGAAITALSGANSTGDVMKAIAGGANLLDAGSTQTWSSLLTTLEKVDGLNNIFQANSGKNVRDLAAALSGSAPDTSKAAAWQMFLDALGTNSNALSSLTGKSAEETTAWLTQMAEAANKIEPDNAEAWNSLLANFVTGLPGLSDTEAGAAFFQQLTLEFLAMGTESEEARDGLAALGWSTDQIDLQQKRWLETCRRLVQTIPGLSSVINIETGAVKGGIGSISDYVNAWENAQKKIALLQAIQAKRAALDAKYSELPGLEIDYLLAEKRARENREKIDAIREKYGFDDEHQPQGITLDIAYFDQMGNDLDTYNQLVLAQMDLDKAAEDAEKSFTKQRESYDEAVQELDEATEVVEETYGEIDTMAESADNAAESLSMIQKAAKGDKDALQGVKTALTDAATAMQDVANYAEQARKNVAQSVGQVIHGFGEVITPVDEVEKKMKSLNDSLANATTAEEIERINREINQLGGSKPSIQNMTAGLQSQLKYMEEYERMLQVAREKGVNEGLLSMLSDGSAESYDYLKALTEGTGDIEALNEAYEQVQEKKQGFTNTLTDQQLKTDAAFQNLITKANEAIAALNLGDQAQTAVTETVNGIVAGLSENKESVTKEVDAIMAQINRLSGMGGFSFSVGGVSFSGFSIPGLDTGMDYVPFDNYLARLHEGESVLTAEESKVWRDFKYGARSSAIDYGALGSSIWENAPSMGGNVYLDGQTVGRVISSRQADSYRALERSGWKQ